jgi:gas vesicle protein
MKKSEKLITGLAVGAVVALFLVPKSRKMIYDAMCSLTGTLKNVMHKADDMAANAKSI